MSSRTNILIRDLANIDSEVMDDFTNYFNNVKSYNFIIGTNHGYYYDDFNFENNKDNKDKKYCYILNTSKYNMFFKNSFIFVEMLKKVHRPFVVLKQDERSVSGCFNTIIGFVL